MWYEVTQEGAMAGRCRSDQRWIKEHGSGVYIEHENRCDAKIDGEIQKLCNDVSKLKVLITYVSDKNFDDNVGQLTESIRTAMRNYRATFTGELLLIVAGEHEQEREAHISALRMEPL